MRNMCDGCQRGLPLVDGWNGIAYHKGNGYDTIGCTKHLYKLIQMTSVGTDHYVSKCGLRLKREKYTRTPNGNLMANRWALRGYDFSLIDFDQYRNDIAERHNLNLFQPITWANKRISDL